MTAIYLYFNNVENKAICASDNYDFINERIVDKISFIQNRWIISFYGMDILDNTINIINYFSSFSNIKPYSSTNDLINDITNTNNKISTNLYPCYKKAYDEKKINEKNWNILSDNGITFIIFDIETFEAFSVNLGFAIPPIKLLKKPEILKLLPMIFHRFALAANIPHKPFDHEIIENPLKITIIEKIINNDRKINENIGLVGTYFILDNKNIQFKSAFKNYDEYINSFFNPKYYI